MAMTQNGQRDIKNVSSQNTKHIAPRDTHSGNRDELPDSRDVKRAVEKPKSDDK